MLKQLKVRIEPRLQRIQFIDRRIRVLHQKLVQEIRQGFKEGVEEGFKMYTDKNGNTHSTPFTK